MVSISLCMIVKNEEDSIGQCLESIYQLVDEINIIDTGSNDQTKKIASKYTDRIYDFEWVHDFSKARNYAFEKATKDYILWLDADDVFLEEDQQKLLALKLNLESSVDSVTMKYILATDEYGNVTSSLRRNRLVKRRNGFRWIGAVHEYLEVWGNIMNSEVAVTHKSIHHDSDRNLKIYEKKLLTGEDFSPRDLYYFANELKDHRQFKRAIEFYEKFLSTEKGWIEDNIAACRNLADCYHEIFDKERMIKSLLRSFTYTAPRPEICCRLAHYFIEKNDYQSAVFWYDLATKTEVSQDNCGIQNPVFSTWIPHLQLCVCYDALGDYEKANHHNELAGAYRPNDPKYLHNKEYLKTKFSIEKVGEGNGV
ncbi:glycosyltransferase involved in cell wall biosynthesis [Bacillus aryabhattai]|uniref:Glycosyltransferase involved in cell wall biosynthesis n=1 Tax=Priestia aryabhattai TaxID=412384 RepID=A0A7W3NH31_PRIAR|nr:MULTISPECIES: glycosyltransferase [Priestia]MBA9042894.1 glycosyltransferase involved in cell wall biosynthesis [Priestia aryabhattai]MED4760868.1 glycosyltransferase [Priestia megaterium]